MTNLFEIPSALPTRYWTRIPGKQRKLLLDLYDREGNAFKLKQPVPNAESLRSLLQSVGYHRHEFSLQPPKNGGLRSSDARFTFLQAMYEDSSARVRHFDGVRQKYMNYALVVFAALITLGGRNSLPLQCSASITVTILMCVFCAFDRHLHRLSHQWQSHANLYYELMCDLLNEPKNPIQWDKWESEHAGPAEWRSFQPAIYYCLVGISVLSLPLWIFIARLQ